MNAPTAVAMAPRLSEAQSRLWHGLKSLDNDKALSHIRALPGTTVHTFLGRGLSGCDVTKDYAIECVERGGVRRANKTFAGFDLDHTVVVIGDMNQLLCLKIGVDTRTRPRLSDSQERPEVDTKPITLDLTQFDSNAQPTGKQYRSVTPSAAADIIDHAHQVLLMSDDAEPLTLEFRDALAQLQEALEGSGVMAGS